MTSTWIQSAPAWSTARTSSPSFAKSAARIDGATRRGRAIDSSSIRCSLTRRAEGGNVGAKSAGRAAETSVSALPTAVPADWLFWKSANKSKRCSKVRPRHASCCGNPKDEPCRLVLFEERCDVFPCWGGRRECARLSVVPEAIGPAVASRRQWSGFQSLLDRQQ